VPYRVTSIHWRMYFTVLSGAACLLALYLIFSDPNGTQPANVALMSVLLVWAAVVGARGWRSATLLAFDDKVRVRTLIKTTSWPWHQIDRFVADTRPVLLLSLPILHRPRRALGVRLRGGQTYWLYEISCRPADAGSTSVDASAAMLNELLGMHTPRAQYS
jgi:hypothetical protein